MKTGTALIREDLHAVIQRIICAASAARPPAPAEPAESTGKLWSCMLCHVRRDRRKLYGKTTDQKNPLKHTRDVLVTLYDKDPL